MTSHMANSPSQLDRIEAKVVRIELEQQEQTGLLTAFLAKGQIIMSAVTDLATQLDAATTAEAASLAGLSAKIDAENSRIDDVKTELQSLFDRLQSGAVTPADLASITASIGKLSSASSTIDAATTAIDAQTARLTDLAHDPSNPVPTPAPTTT